MAWPDGIAELCSWPQRTALLLAPEPYPTVADGLRRLGFTTVLVPPSLSSAQLASLDPFTFVLVAPEALQQAGLDMLRTLRTLSSVARFLLLAAADAEASVLLAGIRAGVQEVVDPGDQIALLTTLRAQLDTAGRGRERVLAIGAHPDDVEIGCGGTLLEHRRQGDRISMLTLSRGSIGGPASDRTQEAAAAASMIGAQLLLGDLPDTRVSDGIETIGPIEQVVAALAPTVVYVHSAHDNHQDHRAVHAATLSATRDVATVLAYQSPSANNGFLPTTFVPIDQVMTHKLDLLASYRSQAGRSYLEPDAIVASARYWARHLSARARHAEPFETVRAIRPISGPTLD
jgi:LmbE family N-acetylglucosaminyl deacetylase